VNLVQTHIQFIGSNNGQSGQDALPQLHFAGEYAHQARLGKIKPIRYLSIGMQIAGQNRSTIITIDCKTSGYHRTH
jgi:hypothetical protein